MSLSTPAQEPLVTIVIPSFNHCQYVGQAIDSALEQTYPNIQLIVIDDASRDGSQEAILGMQTRRPFTFLQNQHNLGLNASLDRAMAAARGDFISVLASDDVLERSKVERQVGYLQRTGLDGVFSSGSKVHANGRVEPIDSRLLSKAFERQDALRLLYTKDTVGPYLQSGLFRTHVFLELGWVRQQFRSDDWALAIAMIQRFKIGFLDERLFRYRIHSGNSHNDYWRTFPMRVEVICALTPVALRDEAIANLLASQAVYLTLDGEAARSSRYHAAAFALDPSRRRLWEWAKISLRPLAAAVGLTSAQRAQRAQRRAAGSAH